MDGAWLDRELPPPFCDVNPSLLAQSVDVGKRAFPPLLGVNRT